MNLSTIVTAAGDDKAMERISKARTVLVIRQPFWGTLALYLKLECTRSIETMSTDGIKLYFNPDFVLGLDFDELVGCIAHEVSHCAYRHHVRRGKRELGLWNDAADLVINPLLRAAGFKLPDGALEESRFNGLASEEVYARLYSEREAKKKAAGICRDFGWGVVDVGGIGSAHYLEAMCLVWVLAGALSGNWNQAFKLLRQ